MKVHGVNSEDWQVARKGDRVLADGLPGVVAEVFDGPFPTTEIYIVELDNGLGGGEYGANEIEPLSQASSSVEVEGTAAKDYPELGNILHERPPLAHAVTASLKKTAAEPCNDCGSDERRDTGQNNQCECGAVYSYQGEQKVKGKEAELWDQDFSAPESAISGLQQNADYDQLADSLEMDTVIAGHYLGEDDEDEGEPTTVTPGGEFDEPFPKEFDDYFDKKQSDKTAGPVQDAIQDAMRERGISPADEAAEKLKEHRERNRKIPNMQRAVDDAMRERGHAPGEKPAEERVHKIPNMQRAIDDAVREAPADAPAERTRKVPNMQDAVNDAMHERGLPETPSQPERVVPPGQKPRWSPGVSDRYHGDNPSRAPRTPEEHARKQNYDYGHGIGREDAMKGKPKPEGHFKNEHQSRGYKDGYEQMSKNVIRPGASLDEAENLHRR